MSGICGISFFNQLGRIQRALSVFQTRDGSMLKAQCDASSSADEICAFERGNPSFVDNNAPIRAGQSKAAG